MGVFEAVEWVYVRVVDNTNIQIIVELNGLLMLESALYFQSFLSSILIHFNIRIDIESLSKNEIEPKIQISFVV